MAVLEWIRLLRLPNQATAVADVLAGWLIVSQARSLQWPAPAAWWAIAAHSPDAWVTVELYPYRDRPDDAARTARAHLLGVAAGVGVQLA